MIEGNTEFKHQFFFSHNIRKPFDIWIKTHNNFILKRKWYQWMNDIIPAKNYSLIITQTSILRNSKKNIYKNLYLRQLQKCIQIKLLA